MLYKTYSPQYILMMMTSGSQRTWVWDWVLKSSIFRVIDGSLYL